MFVKELIWDRRYGSNDQRQEVEGLEEEQRQTTHWNGWLIYPRKIVKGREGDGYEYICTSIMQFIVVVWHDSLSGSNDLTN